MFKRFIMIIALMTAFIVSTTPVASASNSFFDTPVPPTQTVDANSSFYISKLLAWTNAKNTWINTGSYSVPVYVVPPWQPNVKVRVTRNNGDPGIPALQSDWASVPIPLGAKPAAGTDSHMVVVQPDTDKMWEFWGGTGPENDGTLNWHAAWGGAFLPGQPDGGYNESTGYYQGRWYDRFGATATGISVLGGLITASDLFSGQINHELAVGVPSAEAKCFAWPASRTDGNIAAITYTDANKKTQCDLARPTAIPEGARFFLPASVDISGCSPQIVCMIDRALQKYGMVVRDSTGSSLTFYAEDLSAEGKPAAAVYNYFIPDYPNNLLARVPWSKLQVMDTNAGWGVVCCWNR